MKRLLRLLTLTTCAVMLGCERDVIGPERTLGPGPLELVVTSPNAEDGALMIALSGGPIDSVTSEFEVTALEVSPGDYRLLIRGAVLRGSVIRLWVPDRGRRSAYAASVAQAVDRSTYARRNVLGYTLKLDLGR